MREYEILDTSWVKPFIHNIFFGDSKDADSFMAKKMPYMNRTYYKYCYVCEESKRTADTIDHNINNFENDELFFQDPALFNDPFDCYMGFSQNQMMKDLLVANMKKQGKYTPQMRKAINVFFGNSTEKEISIDDMSNDEIKVFISALIPTISPSLSDDAMGQKYISEIMELLTKEENIPLLVKLIKNQLTVADQQAIIDILFANATFREYTKSSLENPENSEWIINATQHDMKLRVETKPDSFMNGGGTDVFQSLDFFEMLLKAATGGEVLSELSEVKQKFSEASNSAMVKCRKMISEKCRVTCLSERMDSPLMWSHYANKHFGFCLEYDFTHTMVKRYPDLNMAKIMLLPVIYSEKRPLLSRVLTNSKIMLPYYKTGKMPMEVVESIVYGLLFKSPDWSYEREWRIIGMDMEKPTMKLPSARKVFLGANMEESAKARVIEIAKKKHIPVYQMMLSSDRYKFEYYKVE